MLRNIRYLVCWLAVLFSVLPFGAGAATYSYTSTPFSWVDPSSHTNVTWTSGASCSAAYAGAPVDDDITAQLNLGFTFNFGGVNYTQVQIMSNGRLQFGNGYCGFGTQSVGLPRTYPLGFPNASLVRTMKVYGADFDPSAGGTVRYAFMGTAPNRSFVVTWTNVPEWNSPAWTCAQSCFNVQAILYESGEFVYQYGTSLNPSNGKANIGWELTTTDYGLVTYTNITALANTAYRFFIPAPVAEYRMEETSWTGSAGEVADSSGNNRNGVAVGTVQTTANGKICRGADIPANTSRTTVDAVDTGVAVDSVMGGEGGITLWYKGNAAWNDGNDRMLLDGTSNNSAPFFLSKRSDGRLRFVLQDGANNVLVDETGTHNLAANTWHHIAITWSDTSNRMTVYLDGAVDKQINVTINGGITNQGGTLFIGDNQGKAVSNNPTGNSANGVIDEVHLYNYEIPSTVVNRDLYLSRPCVVTVIPGRFNAYETTTAAGAISGVIKTKIAQQSFNLDLIAINTAGTAIETAFTGTVKVELLDASDNSGALDANGCRSTWIPIQTLATNPNFITGDNGRKTVSFQEANAWKDVRVRVTYPASGAASAVGCSNDNFAIRPAQFSNVAVTDQTWATAGVARGLANTSVSGGVVHKAGQPMSLSARAVGALGNLTTNYADTPAATPIACLLPTGCSNGNLGTFAVGASAVAGVLTSNNASYSEVGAFSMQLIDANFAAVDLADGSTAVERDVTSAVVNVGRFVPDHFDMVASNAPQLKTFNDTSCASRSFTYIGQPFGYVTAPQAAVVAKNAAGGTTVNYANNLWKLTTTGVTQTYTSVPATPLLTATVGAPIITSNNDGTGFITANGSDTLIYAHTTAAPFPAPFNADIALAMSVEDSAENGASQGIITTSTPATFNGGGAGLAFDAGNAFRYGRLRLSNAHGSERLPLNVPVRAEYFNGSIFVTNAADSCTGFTLATDLTLSNYQRNLNPGETTPSPANIVLSSGVSAITLSAPATATSSNSGSVDLTLTVPNWLQFNWSGAVANPKARATFGVYRNANEFIYLREAY